jgi:hypothetical protein
MTTALEGGEGSASHPGRHKPVKKELFFLNRCTRQSLAESDDTRGCIYIYNYNVDLLKMSKVMLETCRGF